MTPIAAVLNATALAAFSQCTTEVDMPSDRGHYRAHSPEVSGSLPPSATEIENAAVRVIRMRFAARQKIPMHAVTPRVVVLLTDMHLRLTFPNGSTSELHRKAGETVWLDAQQHAGENLSDQPVELIAVVPK